MIYLGLCPFLSVYDIAYFPLGTLLGISPSHYSSAHLQCLATPFTVNTFVYGPSQTWYIVAYAFLGRLAKGTKNVLGQVVVVVIVVVVVVIVVVVVVVVFDLQSQEDLLVLFAFQFCAFCYHMCAMENLCSSIGIRMTDIPSNM